MAPLSPMTENETVKKSCCMGSAVVPSPVSNSNANVTGSTMAPASAPPTKRTPNDFIFGKVIGEGSFSTVSHTDSFVGNAHAFDFLNGERETIFAN